MGHIIVEGFTFERCANQSAAAFWESERRQCGAVGFRAGHHIRFIGNVVRHAKTIGIDVGIGGGAEREDGVIPYDNLIEDNVICDNGEVGVCGQRSRRTIIRNNIIERNSCLSLATVEEAGLKFHEFIDGVIEGNVIRDNEAAGIWLDAVWTGARVSRNFVVNNVASGIFIELGADKAIVDHNIVAYTRLGDGIYSHDASDVLIAHNLVFGNAHFGIYMRYVTDRPFPHADEVTRPAECSNNRILNNLFIDNYRGHICLPAVGERSKNNLSEGNHFINGTQWQWEGLGFHRFCLGDNDGDLPRAVLDSQLMDAGVAPDSNSGNAYLKLEEWQLLGFDRHSFAPGAFRITSENGAVVKGTATLGARDPYFELRLSPEAACRPVSSLPECPRDYFGRHRSPNSSPGPFCNLPEGRTCFDVNPRIAAPHE
jgi:parallel beta-helix repeat protein